MMSSCSSRDLVQVRAVGGAALLLVLFMASVPVQASCPQGTPAHPYMFFTEDDIPGLRASFVSDSTRAALFQKLIQRADALIRDPNDPSDDIGPISAALYDSGGGGDTRGYEGNLKVLAFAYVMTDTVTEPMVEPATRDAYLALAKSYTDSLVIYPYWMTGANCWLNREAFGRGLAIAYDWLYCELDSTTRQDIVNKLEDEQGSTDPTETVFCSGAERPTTGAYLELTDGDSEPWFWNRPWQNHLQQSLSSLGISGYAIHNEHQPAQAWIDFVKQRFAEMDPVMPPDGSWHEGVPYWSYAVGPSLPFYTLAKELDEDLFPSDSFHQNNAAFLTYMTAPDDSAIYSYGDAWANIAPLTGNLLMLATSAREYQDGYAQGLLERIYGSAIPGAIDPLTILAYDTTLEPSDLLLLSLSREFDDLGMFSTRNSFTDPSNQHFLAFKSGWPGGVIANENENAAAGFGLNNGHDDRDHNSFIYFDAGEMLLHDWFVVGASLDDKLTHSHNTITVGDSLVGQREPRSVEGDDTLFQEYKTTGLMSVVTDPDYTHVKADAHVIYEDGACLDKFERQIVIGPEYFVLFDMLEIDRVSGPCDETTEANWHFHTPGTIDADSLDVDHHLTYTVGDESLVQTVVVPEAADATVASVTKGPTEIGQYVTINREPGEIQDHFLSVFISSGAGAGAEIKKTSVAGNKYSVTIQVGSRSDTIKFDKTTGDMNFNRAGNAPAPGSGDLLDDDPVDQGSQPPSLKLGLYFSSRPTDRRQEILYTVPSDGLVRLTVFDVAGRRVEKLVGSFENRGEHTIHWDVSAVASGIYFYRLEKDNEVVTAKTLIIR